MVSVVRVEGDEFIKSSLDVGLRYLNMGCFVPRRRYILFDSHCLSTCVCYERRDRLSSHRSLNSDSLNSLLEKLLDTHRGHLHT